MTSIRKFFFKEENRKKVVLSIEFGSIYSLTMLLHYFSDPKSFSKLMEKVIESDSIIEKVGETLINSKNFFSMILMYLCIIYFEKLIKQFKTKKYNERNN